MISHSQNRVQAIKSKFENLTNETPVIIKKTTSNGKHLIKHTETTGYNDQNAAGNNDKENEVSNHIINDEIHKEKSVESDASDDWSAKPNMSYLYNKNDVKRSTSDTKKSLVRQTSDPGKKLHRSHAFRCDRSQKIVSPKRHGSCNGRSETSDFSLKMEKRLSKDRLKRLGNLLEDQMRKENFVPLKNNEIVVGEVHEVKITDDRVSETSSNNDSIPDSEVPRHILDQYAKVIKPKKKDAEKQDAMTDSGVSSETENQEEEKSGRIKKLMSNFEKTDENTDIKPNTDTNLESMTVLCASSDTIRLERKNPHLVLTDTLKKALKQPLPPGPPPKKPPRSFIPSIPESPEKQKKDTKKMLEKLEQVLQKREAQNQSRSSTVDKSSTLKKPKEIHYLCTEILDITQRTLLPNQGLNTNCFKSLNCAISNNYSTLSLPYSRFSNDLETQSLRYCCSCKETLGNETKRLSTFLAEKCKKCQLNEQHDGFKCHLNCKCKTEKSEFFVDENEHIYDEVSMGENSVVMIGRSNGSRINNGYGSLNHSKSLEDLRIAKTLEDEKIYDIPCEVSRPATPEFITSSPKTDFQKLRQNFEIGFKEEPFKKPMDTRKFDTEKPIDTRKVHTEKPMDTRKFDTEKPMDTRKFDTEKAMDTRKFGTEKPPMKPKPVFIKNKLSKSIENMADGKGTDVKRYRKMRGDSGTRLSFPKKDTTQLDVDRENLNRLMNEIYATVTEACNMDEHKPGSFPTEQSDGSTSEDSVKLTRSLTEKRKNYVRRVSSRVAYLDPKNLKATRFRHQTSICSYKSEVIDNPYSTFRSWKSFRTSQNNLSKESKMADRRESTDSKFNLTDSKGNLLSMKGDFDSSDSIDNLSIDEKTGCVDIDLSFERERGLFNICLLVGLNYMTGQAYVKSVFPSQVQVPPHIENLIFPETLSSTSKGEWSAEAKGTQCYSLVLTDERGERSYGYCRRVLPEGATTCLPLCYCIIGKYRAPGFYYKVLQEIESHHGSSDVEIHSILQQLFETDFPHPGEEITISYTSRHAELSKNYRNSVNLGDILKCKTMPDMRQRKSDQNSFASEKYPNMSEKYPNASENYPNVSENYPNVSEKYPDVSDNFSNDREVFNKSDSEGKLPEFYDLENNNSPKRVLLSLEGVRTKILKRPIEPRIDEDNLSVLLDCLGAGLTIKVFGSLLLERKVLIIGDKLSLVSSCMEALQTALYPFVWQQPLISCVPAEIQRDVLEAPLPILAGMLVTSGRVETAGVIFEEGMLIDLTNPSKVLFYQGDESTILPTPSYKTLKTSLQMESKQKDRQEDTKTRNVMISEAFLRFFVDILGDFWRFFTVGELKEGDLGKGDVVFDKEAFIKNATTKQNQYFLEWFTETAMFNHFIQNMAVSYHNRQNTLTTSTSSKDTRTSPNFTRTSSKDTLTSSKDTRTSSNFTRTSSIDTTMSELQFVDTPLPDYYELFDERVKSRSKSDVQKNVDGKNNYKNAVNKRVKLLKTKLRELVT